ncbi:chloride intracellular channel exc-4 [Octopus bimaculoides]|uniref:chloride intracellular channel exc-4 n=1 Tax=Octopus bimaculoides TaxID=37653 RepID=UPI00071E0221|nr:chloride intracellular channel exc-4 [Octopus bimaculoides]|eukprot:XP_014782446.1 PREDICTED: chloride intracellular channel exc-4-like [Octopus bimaculoides]
MIPEFELWIKASVLDKVSKGACPLCQQWYMVAYILAENKLASFKVITVPDSNPPRILREKSSSGLFPVVIGVTGETLDGASVEGLVADESCELEQFFQMFKCPLLKMDSSEQIVALNIFLDLNTTFNRFLSTGSDRRLNEIMSNLNNHLKENETKFMIGDELTYVDCVLLPRLQHVRVAGSILKNYDIPRSLVYLWRYLQNGYNAEAFYNTCPTDPVIISHYQKKVAFRGREASLMKETTTLTIPNDIVLDIKSETEELDDIDAQEEVNKVKELSEMTSNISVENGNGAVDFSDDTGEVNVVSDNTTEVIVHEVYEDTPDTVIVTSDLGNSNHNDNDENPAD